MKKVLSLLLVLVLALGMSTVAFAAGGKINKEPGTQLGFSGIAEDFGDYAVVDGAGKDYLLTKSMFAGTTGWATTGGTNVLKTDVTASKLTVRTKVSKGSNVIKTAELAYKTNGDKNAAYIKVRFVYPFKSNNTDGQDFDFTVYPVVDGRAWSDLGASFVGTYKNPEASIDANTDYIDLSYSAIAVVDEYSKTVEYSLGEGVSLFGRAIKGAKYWGVANNDATAAEDEMMAAKGIDMVYHVPVIGLSTVANYVVLNDADPTAYVYDKDLKYLGLAKEHLPYADTYYLAAKKLDVETEEEPEEEPEAEEEVPVAPPVTGGTGTVAPTYDNPSTGK